MFLYVGSNLFILCVYSIWTPVTPALLSLLDLWRKVHQTSHNMVWVQVIPLTINRPFIGEYCDPLGMLGMQAGLTLTSLAPFIQTGFLCKINPVLNIKMIFLDIFLISPMSPVVFKTNFITLHRPQGQVCDQYDSHTVNNFNQNLTIES